MRETVERAREAGGEITSHLCDATDSSAVSAMVDACINAHGRIDILVNNVGGSAAGGPVELPEDAWHRQLAYNLGTVFLACKHVLPVMVRRTAAPSSIYLRLLGFVSAARRRSDTPPARPASFNSPAWSRCSTPDTASA
jgi:NAD(P)-dependent dehydrogenase (short-subunit alcohol dehydrogenase family)